MQLSDRIGRRLKLQDLHVLMAVVQAGTMGKAAQQLNTTQPNISRAIADLEHAFGGSDGRFYVLKSGDRVVGTGSYERVGKDRCELKRFYLDREYQGKGLGRRFLA